MVVCKTCGCAGGAVCQLELLVNAGSSDEPMGLGTLSARLLGAAGLLHVSVDETSGQVLADFNPLRTSQQDIEAIVNGYGYEVISSKVNELPHQHGVVVFLKRILRK